MRWRKFDLKDSPFYEAIVKMERESEYDRQKRLMTVCRKCRYAGITGATQSRVTSCDYILITGRIRPCCPVECMKEGVFLQADGKRRTYRLSI